jgi:hypothetical protein
MSGGDEMDSSTRVPVSRTTCAFAIMSCLV